MNIRERGGIAMLTALILALVVLGGVLLRLLDRKSVV